MRVPKRAKLWEEYRGVNDYLYLSVVFLPLVILEYTPTPILIIKASKHALYNLGSAKVVAAELAALCFAVLRWPWGHH